MKKIVIFLGLFLLVYCSSWFILGESLLFEQGLKRLLKEDFLKYHKGKEFIIISKINDKIVVHKYSTQLPGRVITTINNLQEQTTFFEKLQIKKNTDEIILLGMVIVIKKNNPLGGAINCQLIPNDSGTHLYYIWAIFDWIELP